jgi:hypothetical protein
MKCAIMQPTYFPWAGYFSLIDRVDVFVFLDDAQYEKGTWQNRNRVLVNGQPHWLTVPAQREFLGQAINQVRFDERRNWREKHFRLLSQAYAKHPHAGEMLQLADAVLDAGLARLADLNIRIISALAQAMGSVTRMRRSSELDIGGTRTERLIALCKRLECDEYVSPPGSAGYLAEDGFTAKTSIRLTFNEYVPAAYPQLPGGNFISHLSLLDVIANIGTRGAADYVRQSGEKA